MVDYNLVQLPGTFFGGGPSNGGGERGTLALGKIGLTTPNNEGDKFLSYDHVTEGSSRHMSPMILTFWPMT
jgi:hypothetical protein